MGCGIMGLPFSPNTSAAVLVQHRHTALKVSLATPSFFYSFCLASTGQAKEEGGQGRLNGTEKDPH